VAWTTKDDGCVSGEMTGSLGIEEVSLNNNNRGNNRRRGRGNNRQNGGGQQLNRIDSRARGNAPQLLEKYRKLAHDAHLNGDRVTEEYYLQFADHYFRVIADARVRQEENRPGQGGGQGPRRDDRWSENGDGDREYGDDSSDYNDGYDEPRNERYERHERQPAPEPRREPVVEQAAAPEPEEQPVDALNPYEPVENPFVRDGRSGRGLKQRRPRAERAGEPAGEFSLDPATLPPAVSSSAASSKVAPVAEESEPEAIVEASEEAAPAKPRRRARKPRQAVDDAGEALQPVT